LIDKEYSFDYDKTLNQFGFNREKLQIELFRINGCKCGYYLVNL